MAWEKPRLALAKGLFFWRNQSDIAVLMSHKYERYPVQKYQNLVDPHLNPKYGVKGSHLLCLNLPKEHIVPTLLQLSQMRPNL